MKWPSTTGLKVDFVNAFTKILVAFPKGSGPRPEAREEADDYY
jgi:hypothetical protein